jgi:hypothetical protein
MLRAFGENVEWWKISNIWPTSQKIFENVSYTVVALVIERCKKGLKTDDKNLVHVYL